ncbi:srs domain-containing protein [Cystoisospora suis]|uniref:Srs domain-containing protein n=1 Tax=Cystoisospora suis TaxID=483139 RepID=A0A2C6KL59_9APIC|nr:srs domain-containing protein [Cystoisospora suis]
MGLSKSRFTAGVRTSCRGWLTTSAAVTLLLLPCACFSVLAQQASKQELDSQSASHACPNSNGVSSCRCEPPSHARVDRAALNEFTATLSEESPKMDLSCVGPKNNVAPDTMSQGSVCAGSADVETCFATAAAGDGSTVKLDTLLAQGTTDVVWKKESTTGEDQQKYALAVPGDAFPLLDQQFFVGCKAADPPNAPVCKVSVALKARKSATAGQTVTCAYGSASNATRQSVTLTPSHNKLSVSCGKEGTIVPAENLKNFCAYGEDPSNCNSQAFTELFPGSDQSWWSTKEGNQAILTIPADKFPAEDRKFALGCKHTPTDLPSNRDGANSQPAPRNTSLCSVDVIITSHQKTTTTTSSTSSASSSMFVAGDGGSVLVALVSFYALQQALSSLG